MPSPSDTYCMKSFPFTTSALALGLALFVPTVLRAQDHGHLNAGALGKGQGASLYFANGPDCRGQPGRG